MQKRISKLLAIILSMAMLFSISAAAAPPSPDQSTPISPVENYDFSEADFTGNPGPDDLDYLYPSNQAGTPSTFGETSLTDIKNIVIMVNFSGMDEFVTPTRFATLNGVYNTRANSLKGYSSHISYNTLNVDSDFYPKAADGTTVISYVDPHPIEYYKTYSTSNTLGYQTSSERFNREKELVTGAFNYVKSQVEADFTGAQLDNNNDSYIDSMAFIINGYRGTGGGIAWNDLLWPHKYSTSGLTMNGKSIRNYNFLLADIPPAGNPNLNDHGLMPEDPDDAQFTVIIHEFMHTLDFPDLYHYNASGNPVTEWDIMGYTYSTPQNMLQYMQREYKGWGKPIHEITASGTQTLQVPKYVNADTDGGYDGSPEAAIIIRSPYSTTEFFVVEYRVKSGFDEGLPGSGLIIYRINTSVTGKTNASGPPDYVYIFRPNETSATAGEGNLSNAYFSSQSGRTSIGKAYGMENEGFDNQTLFFSDGSNSGIVINQVGSAGGDTITFNVTIPTGDVPAMEGTGTAADPYQIILPGQLSMIKDHPDKHYKLMKNINCSTLLTYTPAENFTGELNGNNFAIKNLTYSSDTSKAGLFASVSAGGSIHDLTLENCIVAGRESVGVLAGTFAGTAERVKVVGGNARNNTVTTYDAYAGGIVGSALSGAVISGCTTSASVAAQTAGGFAGMNNGGTWSYCYADSVVGGVSRDSIRAALFGKQVVSNTYLPGNGLYWNMDTCTLPNAANVTKTSEIAYTGLEGIVGVGVTQNLAVTAGQNVTAALRTDPSTATINGTWASSNTAVATVSNGVVTGVSAGTAEITYTVYLYGFISMQVLTTVTVSV